MNTPAANDGHNTLVPDPQPLRSVPRMVGRDQALQHVISAFYQAEEHGPRLAVVSGEKGIGKTRLLQAFEQELSRLPRDIVVWRSDALAGEETAPFAVVRSWMNTACGVCPRLSA